MTEAAAGPRDSVEPPVAVTGDPFFFVHVMKTAGSTFRQHVRANFAAAERYPDDEEDADLVMAKLSVPRLLALPPARHARIRIYTGHFPYCAATQLDRPLTTLTILRDPVERAISHLKQETPPGGSLEATYEDPAVQLRIVNHQVRMFAFTAEDRIENFATPLDIDERRFAIACQHLAAVHLVGFQEDFEGFLGAVEARFGWVRASVQRVRVGPDVRVSDDLRRRIAADSEPDIAFHAYARRLAG
jgi:hypothetical protein